MKLQAMTPEQVKESGIYKEWGLTENEYQEINRLLGRMPNYTETGIFSGMWSEHCSYKTSKPILKNFYTEGKQVIQGPGEGAGIVDIGDNQGVVFKMESHNSPSAVEPYEGAATGVGGVVRDIFSMGAEPIALVDSLRFGDLSLDTTKNTVNQAVAGIADYGNRLGVPTIGGETKFDRVYNNNPLINAMCIGLVDQDSIFKGVADGEGNTIMYVGSTTGRDGIHGASFSSKELNDDNKGQGSAVQAGDSFKEKRLIDACLELLEKYKDEVIGMQDMGAAGLVSSSTEMAEKAGKGMKLNMDLVPQREENMTAYELLLSESQERMLVCVKKGSEKEISELFKAYDLFAVEIGQVIEEGQYKIYQNDELVVDVPVDTLTDKVPTNIVGSKEPERLARFQKEKPFIPTVSSIKDTLEQLLYSPDLASKASLYSQYDFMAKNNTIVGPGEGSGIVRIKGTEKALAVTSDGNSRFVYLDPYKGGQIAVSEASRNIIASGGLPLAITDCLNFGTVNDPEVFYELEQSSYGISNACQRLNTPVISGNVSLNNAGKDGSIYPTPVIGMVGLIENIDYILSQKFTGPDQLIYLVGETADDFSGSVIQKLQSGELSGQVNFDMEAEQKNQEFVYQANQNKLLKSAHDLSEGGLLVGLAEMSFGSEFGFDVSVDIPDDQLFSETQSRFILTVNKEDRGAFEKLISETNQKGVVEFIGKTTREKLGKVKTTDSNEQLDLTLLEENWENVLAEKLN